jgi:hypothetical protein
MSLLLAALRIEAERAAKRFAAALVERSRGFSDRSAGDFLSGADVLADAEAEKEVHEPTGRYEVEDWFDFVARNWKYRAVDPVQSMFGSSAGTMQYGPRPRISTARPQSSAPAAHSPGPVAAESPEATSTAVTRSGASGHLLPSERVQKFVADLVETQQAADYFKDVPADLAASGTDPGEVSATRPDLAPSPGQLLREHDRDILPIIRAVLADHRFGHSIERVAEVVLDAIATALDALK